VNPYDDHEGTYEGRPPYQVWEHHPDPELSGGGGAQVAGGASPSSASAEPSRQTSQAERAVMHPDRHDAEWRYCRGGWAG
jgi:hypothetical protein